MSTGREVRNYDEPRRPKNEWQAKREAAWRSADQFRYRQMNREYLNGNKGFEADDGEDASEDETETDAD